MLSSDDPDITSSSATSFVNQPNNYGSKRKHSRAPYHGGGHHSNARLNESDDFDDEDPDTDDDYDESSDPDGTDTFNNPGDSPGSRVKPEFCMYHL